MPPCATQTFANISLDAWACLKDKVTAAGYTITGDSGSASGNGVTIAWQYDAAAQTLSITCTNRPFFVTCATVNGKIHELIDGSGCVTND